MYGMLPFLPYQYEEMRKQDLAYIEAKKAKKAQKAAKNGGLQSFTPGDAKKGAGLFKVSRFHKLLEEQYG